jgi:chemotaxis signal transduction protein
VQALLVPLHDDWYAIELTRVREVLAFPFTTPLPGAPPALLGVFNLHGEVVPLFDLAQLLGLPAGPQGDRVAVADTERGPAGLTMHGRPDLGELDDLAARPARLLDVDMLVDP